MTSKDDRSTPYKYKEYGGKLRKFDKIRFGVLVCMTCRNTCLISNYEEEL